MSSLEKQSLARSIGNATAWSFAAEIAAKGIVPITNILLARILAPEVFGIIASINMIVSFADALSTAGFQKYLIQHEYNNQDEFNKSTNVAFWTNLCISSLIWGMIAIFRESLSTLVGNEGYGFPLMVAALVLPLTGLSSIQEALFQRKLNYKVLFIRRICVSLLPFIVTIPLALLGFDYWSLIIGNIAGGILKVVLLWITSEWKPCFFYSSTMLKEMLSFSMWTLLESIAMWASTYIDILIISNKMGQYYTGLYKNSQSTVSSILSIITGATTSVLFASLSRYQNDNEKFEEIFYSFQKNVAIFVLPIGVGIFCFSNLVTFILLGEQWMEAASFIGIWGLCTSLVCVFGTFSREVYRAKGQPKISLVAQTMHLAFVIPICWIFVERGFVELAYARSFSYLQIIVVHMFFIKFMFQLSPLKMLLNVKEPILCSIIMGIVGIILCNSFKIGYIYEFFYIFICIIVYFSLISVFPEYRKILLGTLKIILKKLKVGMKSNV